MLNVRTKGLREFKQGLVSYKEEYKRKLNYKLIIQYVEPWRKYDCAYGKGELLIWSFRLDAGIGRVDVGCG